MSRVVFEYALVRASPRVDRGECVNVGVVLYCQARDFLAVQVHVEPQRLRLLDASVDVDGVTGAAAALQRTCAGEGPAGATSLGQRFRWLTSPRSTVVHTGPVHSGLTDDPRVELGRLVDVLVR
ncbi:MAG: hypothetical protein AVDCRST_MAG07-2759 [uncultured Frankineae bacterium]|uniref:DUF3037 domain-containing protein n=1 Tax=uncultured Frankineae bacterium TaxID=437475 RepID=A0A6J4LW01_9ACTN|nr:MAG: hypothetical protein AVDCRST_MAG07-2759 [uncultured Frankineae bacterium]